jgi:UDP-N-acetylglucosamine 2-epimerase (non-hydrolysing)
MGTRPEVIKLAPLVRALRARPDRFQTVVCATAQHRQMLDQALEVFDCGPTSTWTLMRRPGRLRRHRQGAPGDAAGARRAPPDVVVVQGDTTTAFAVALAAFYARTRVAHVEAGLRSWDKHQPFPEEMNRVLASALTDFHFPPTKGAADNLLRAGFPADRVLVTGNTVIDALYQALPRARATKGIEGLTLDPRRRLVLVTGHRRENFGPGVQAMCDALAELARTREDVEIVYPVHLNPNVRGPVHERLGACRGCT